MNDPATAFGRGGWVCAALLLGLFAGSGITWAVVRHGGTKPPPLVVYQLPAPTPERTGESSSAFPGTNTGATSVELTRQDGIGADAALLAVESSSRNGFLAEPRGQGDRILHGHPKAEGCLTNALAALAVFTKKGFDLRDKVWDGEISLDEGKAVPCQLFKGNEYCFSVGTDAKGAKLSLQLYDHNGAPTEAEQIQEALTGGATAVARLKCLQSGTYYVIVKLETASQEKVPWGMVSAYR